jgi:hypothetical protein
MPIRYYKVGIDEAVLAEFRKNRVTPKELYLVDENGDPLENPSSDQIAAAEAQALAKTEANVLQMLFNVPIVNMVRGDIKDKMPADFQVTAEAL